jgi:hypothetical protein
VIIDGGITQNGQSIFGRIPPDIVAKRRKLVQVIDGTEVLPFAPVGSLVIDDPELAAWTHPPAHAASARLLHQARSSSTIRRETARPDDLHRPAPGRAIPVSAGMHEKVQAMAHIRFRPIEAGHNCILSAPDLVAHELLEVP